MINFFKKYHKWLSIILTLFIILFALSGIILNHRQLFSGIDVSRNYLPSDYRYNNWNNAGVAGTEKIGNDSILIYGNIGIWLTDTMASEFTDFNNGFPHGIDNRKVSKVLFSDYFGLYAGTYFGLFKYNDTDKLWQKITLPIHKKRIVDISQKGDTLLVLSRSFLLTSTNGSTFTVHTLPEPEDYDNKIGLFKTLWVIHSGEIYGLPGMLLVDAVGIIFIFLSITGLIYWLIPFYSKRRKKKNKSNTTNQKVRRFSLRWHNKIGWITIILLVITTATGMFLRPPLLAAIAYAKVGKIPFTKLDSPNPWFDKLRRIMYLEEPDIYLVATSDGIYYSNDSFSTPLKRVYGQPPISIMGVTAFEQVGSNTILVGSFEGLFMWNLMSGYTQDYITKGPVKVKERGGPPLGDFLVTGYSNHFSNHEFFFDFNFGGRNIDNGEEFSNMPKEILTQPMSLWNVALEVHTARMYKFMFGNFYILFIPLAGILILFILISGVIVWWKKH